MSLSAQRDHLDRPNCTTRHPEHERAKNRWALPSPLVLEVHSETGSCTFLEMLRRREDGRWQQADEVTCFGHRTPLIGDFPTDLSGHAVPQG